MAIIDKSITPRHLKDFGFVMALVLLLATLALLWKGLLAWIVTFTVAALFIVTAIFSPMSLKKIEAGWMKFGMAIGTVVTHLILTLLFILVITPLGVTLRLFGKRFLELKPDPNLSSYWIKVEKNGPSSRHYLPY